MRVPVCGRTKGLTAFAILVLAVPAALLVVYLSTGSGSTAVGGTPSGDASSATTASEAFSSPAASTLAPPTTTTPAATATPAIVCLLGGSAARESTVSDSSWELAVREASGRAVITYNFGSKGQSFAQDIALVKAFPNSWEGRTIVYVGINLGRFTSSTTVAEAGVVKPSAMAHRNIHKYSKRRILSVSERQEQVCLWLSDRAPYFTRNHASNLDLLEQLIRLCKRRGFTPVLIDLPRDVTAIDGAFDSYFSKVHRECAQLAAEYVIHHVDFVADVDLEHGDFFDICHLVEPGRVKWQERLAQRTAALLREYEL